MPWSKMLIEKEEDFGAALQGRVLKYPAAVREALKLALERDPRVYVMGQGVDDHDGMFGASKDLHTLFPADRVFDTPLSEAMLTGMAAGSAMTGMRPVYLHNRPDFLYLALDQLSNHAAKWRAMFNGQHKVPMVVWSAIGRGWGTGAQHSQAIHALFAHIPGLKLVMPSTPYDAKGLLLNAIADDNPVVIIEHRWAMRHSGVVPEGVYAVPFGKAATRRPGRHLSVVGCSLAILEAQKAAEELASEGWDIEVIDLRTLKPLDETAILKSIAKTGRLMIVDNGWKSFGVSAEIAALAAERGQGCLRASVVRVAAPDCPIPSGYSLEQAYYQGVASYKQAMQAMLTGGRR